ncbi:tetratricopeptide repeat protein [Methanosarcina sp. DH2]|uniref:tetratricopeptide repeat protein n=1 Tax=Methanosarcina sp. DH2 TaxID=2605639 RepID=UPI001E39C9BE|nr:tetratricopeptide repeat protein [Methanosarcina sp. DH2]
MGLFSRKASIGNRVNLTLINGSVFEGEIEGIGEDFTIIKTKRGTAGVYYKMIGAWEILLDSISDQGLEGPLSNMDPSSKPVELSVEPALESAYPGSANEKIGQPQNPETGKETSENEDEDHNLIESQIEEVLGDFKVNVASAKLTLNGPDLSFPLNSLDSTHLQEDKKKWDKINSQYQNCIKNKNYSPLSSLISELSKFAEKYPDIGVFHYNAGCCLAHLEAFEQALGYFEEAFYREPLPEYIHNAAYAALKINNCEKAHINLSVYFNLILPIEDPDTWYIFCVLTEDGRRYSIFKDVLLSLLSKNVRVEETAGKGNEKYNDDVLPLLLKSSIYILQRDKKYRAAESLITALQEKNSEHESTRLENVISLFDSAFKDYSGQICVEYEKLIGYGKLMGVLKEYKGSRIEKSVNSSIESLSIGSLFINSPSTNSSSINSPSTNSSSINSPSTNSSSNNSPSTNSSSINSPSTNSSSINSSPPFISPSNSSLIPEKLKPAPDEVDLRSEDDHDDETRQLEKDFCSKISRRQGQIFKYIAPQGYGFITGQDGKTYFFHVSSIIDSSISNVDLKNVYWGAQIQVVFQPTRGPQGDIAVQISAYHAVNEMQKLALRYADSGDFGKAIEQIEYVLSIDSEHPDSRSLLETWKNKQNKILEEEKSLNELIETEPGNPDGWRLKAEFLIKHKRYEEAFYALDEVIRLTPDFINTLSSKRQLSSFSELCNFNPEYVKALCKKSFVLYQLGRYKETLEIANKVLEIEPDSVDALPLKISSLLELQRPQEALELADTALDMDPENSEFLFLKGKTLLKFHKYEEGLEYLEKAYQLTPENPEIMLRKGYALSKLNRFEEALKAYDKIINLQPDNAKALSNKGFILIMTGKYDDALSMYNGLIQLNPFNPVLWSKKGAILTRMHRSDEALKAVDRALEIVPENSDSLFTRGYIYSKNGMYEEALRHFNSVLELNPYDQKALAKRAFMLSRLGRHDEAFMAIEDALKINLHNSRTWYYKGVLHYNTGEYDKALSALNRSAELNPEDTRIERMKQFTLVELGMPEGKTGTGTSTLKVEEELFDRELQEEYELKFED